MENNKKSRENLRKDLCTPLMKDCKGTVWHALRSVHYAKLRLLSAILNELMNIMAIRLFFNKLLPIFGLKIRTRWAIKKAA